MNFLSLASSGWPRDVQKRYPNHLRMQKNAFPKKLVFLWKSQVFSLGIPVEILLFRSEAATASHLDSQIQSHSWVTPLPHSSRNKKTGFCFFLSFLFSLLSFLCSLLSALEAARGPSTRRHGQEKGWPLSGGLIWGPLAGSCRVSSLFFLLSSLLS